MARLMWNTEETILAADVADDLNWRTVRMTTPQVIELSKLLRQADYHPVEDRDPEFRGVGSVGMKVNNLSAWHPQEGKKVYGPPSLSGRLLRASQWIDSV